MNAMKTKPQHLLFVAVFAGALTFVGCDDNSLKRPKDKQQGESGASSNSDKGGPVVDKTFARELAREFGREFGHEFARQLAANSGLSLPADLNVTLTEPEPDALGGIVDADGNSHFLLAHCAEDVIEFYQKSPEAFTIATPADIPSDLAWTDGSNEEEFSSAKAKRGGTWNVFTRDYPRTLRMVGPDANGAFRGYILDYNVISLVMSHPNSDGYFPGVAKSWAVGKDKRTVYFRLDPAARYSDGKPVRVSDFFFALYYYRNKHIQAPWYNDFFGEDKFLNVTLYDKSTLSITFYKATPDIVERVAIRPIPEHFYEELDEEYLSEYQWKMEPTTGPYHVLPENVDDGVSITLTRVPNWWADEKKFYRNRFNPERIRVTVVRDYNKAFETFLKGELDMFGLALTEFWYEKLPNDHPIVKNGYLTKLTFFNQPPRPSYALRINSQKPPLDNREVRIGFHHAMNFKLVLDKIFRGDFQRMRTVADGYGPRSHPKLQAREFSMEKALSHFAKAGFAKRGPDGILKNTAGERLSFTITTGYKHYEDVLIVLKEEAKKAGVELNLELLEGTAAWKKNNEKKHQVSLSAFNVSVELFPRFWEPFHSDNAYMEDGDSKYLPDGSLKPNLTTKTSTNNFTQTAVREIDHLINEYRESEDLEEITKMAHRLSELLHQHATYVPGWKKPWLRIGHWNWVHFPKDWGPKETRDYQEFHVFWIDESEKGKIIKAKQAEKSVSDEPTVRIYDKYKSD